MPRSKKRKPAKPRGTPKGTPGLSQRGFSRKLFRRRGQVVDDVDIVRMIIRVTQSRGSQAVHRARRAERDPFLALP